MTATIVAHRTLRPLRPLPDPESMPRGLVRIIIWHPTGPGTASGTQYRNDGDQWVNTRDLYDTIDGGALRSWSFDGFVLDGFGLRYLAHPERNTPPLVRLAMWALERWARDRGITKETTA